MDLLTIGAFAKAARLSPKALRLYDDLGLLPPARVDPDTGYRFYAPEQLERARLVAWLRRLGMPLARIQRVCACATEAAAAQEIRGYWAQVEAETAARRDLAGFLLAHLDRAPDAGAAGRQTPDTQTPDTQEHGPRTPGPSEGNAPMPDTTLTLRYSARSDTGLVRPGNQDAVYAGDRLLAVADGFGPAGAPASAAAIEALADLDTGAPLPPGNLLNVLQDAVEAAARAVGTAAPAPVPASAPSAPPAPPAPGTAPVGTTLTAMLWTGTHLALVHIGDSRAYLLRDGELFRITHDHTLVQSMIDDGRLTEAEAASHPDRSLLLRALLSDGPPPTADLKLHAPRPGDRYLLCSDGLPVVAEPTDIRRVLMEEAEPDEATRALIALANGAGGPDNVSCVVADVVAPATP
ncbi:MerR family transcriptional regulator [Streptomyces sp. NBC_00669]|uniref:MerR family transcriptional regulator n=1 Tax=Streptomyces sp. NBC_00669 TaxID=2976011 RepID=UPI002E34C901|nr:MerR family transcriptional regulator [Streptomyces sp. NBC_00669]